MLESVPGQFVRYMSTFREDSRACQRSSGCPGNAEELLLGNRLVAMPDSRQDTQKGGEADVRHYGKTMEQRHGPRWRVFAGLHSLQTPGGAAPALEEVAAGVRIDVGQIDPVFPRAASWRISSMSRTRSMSWAPASLPVARIYCAQGTILDAVTKCSQFVMPQMPGARARPR